MRNILFILADDLGPVLRCRFGDLRILRGLGDSGPGCVRLRV